MKREVDRVKRLLETWTRGPKDIMREVKWDGGRSAHEVYGCSSLRVQGWWMLSINCPGVKISITGGVEKMVRDPKLSPFFRCIFLILFWSWALFYYFPCLLDTKTTCSTRYGKEKPLWQTNRYQGRSHQSKCLLYEIYRTPVMPNKKFNPD